MNDRHNQEEPTGQDQEQTPNAAYYKEAALGGPGLITLVRVSDLAVVFANRQFQHYFGISADDVAQKKINFADLLDKQEGERLQYQLDLTSIDSAAASLFVIYKVRNNTGKYASVYLYASKTNISNNSEAHFHLVLHPDMSVHHMPFLSFNTKELFLQQFKKDGFGTFEWTIDADKVYWSKGIYDIYEVDEGRKVNLAFAQTFVHPTDKERVNEAARAARETGADLDIAYKIVTRNNRIKAVHSLARTLRNKDGKPEKFIGTLRDITNQRAIEEDLKNKVAELNQSNRELEEFAYVASHDMQEPLRKISTFSDRLSEKYKDVLQGDGAMYLKRMMASADSMRSLINNLLEFSKISKTSQPFEAINLNHILRQVKSDLELTIEETGTIINTIQPLPVLEAVASQIKQLLVNIVNNAIKFHKSGITPVITLETTIADDEEKATNELNVAETYYKISITDNGIGFESEYALRIFQVFQRLHGKSEYPGTGIGLAICKKILEYHNGIIYAENLPDQGARFVFIIPEHHSQVN